VRLIWDPPIVSLTATNAFSVGTSRGVDEGSVEPGTVRDVEEFLPEPAASYGREFTLWGDA